jgi:hypothetical protein
MTTRDHWESVYAAKGERDVSWFEPSPDVSMQLIEDAGLARDTCIVDIGGGESRLVDALVGRGITWSAREHGSARTLHRYGGSRRMSPPSGRGSQSTSGTTAPRFISSPRATPATATNSDCGRC